MAKNESIIEKVGIDIGQAKDMENAMANVERYQAFMDYIAVCDHPEMLDDIEMEGEINE